MTQPITFNQHHYRKSDGALLINCVSSEEPELGMTSMPYPPSREIGDWPFFDESTKQWTIVPRRRVTPSYQVVCMFHPTSRFHSRPLVLPDYVKNEEPWISAVCPFILAVREKTEKDPSQIGTGMMALLELKSLNLDLQLFYLSHDRLPKKENDPNSFTSPFHLIHHQALARKIIATMRRILLILLVPYLEIELELNQYEIEDFGTVIDSKKDSSFEFLPPIGRYLNFLNLIRDLDNCFKHERGEWRLPPETLIQPGISLSKLNNRKHYELWRIPPKDCPYIDYSRQEFWHYSIEFDALVTLFSSFLSELLVLPDSQTKNSPPIYFQVTEAWSLADTLPEDKRTLQKELTDKILGSITRKMKTNDSTP